MLKTFGIVALTILLVIGVINPLIGASGSTRFSYGSTAMSDAISVVPTSPTALSSSDTYVFQITIANVTGSAATITVVDGTGKYLLASTSIAANTTYVAAFPEGVKMTSGVIWSAGTSNAIQASVRARRT